MRPDWPNLRAALLLVVIAVHGVAALPLPHVVSRDEVRSPVAAEEIARWAERLTALGYTIDAPTLADRVIAVSGAIGSTHRAALRPFDPVFRLTGTGQGWGLFANPDIYPSRLEIRIRRRGSSGWEVLYRRLDPDHAWADDLLRYRRVRGVYDAGGLKGTPRPPYRRFAGWIGRRALAADPTIEAVEVRMLRTHTTLPGRPVDSEVEARHAVTIPRVSL